MADDKFANYAIISCTESATNTLTFKKLETGISLTEKVAWIINRIEYLLPDSLTALYNASADSFYYGLSISNSWSNPTFDEVAIIDYNYRMRSDIGAAASGLFIDSPITKDFSNLPSGGIIVPPTPLYLYAKGLSLASAATIVARIFYTLKTLKVDEYWELVEARRVLSS